jgi:hypothetical protein
MSTRIHRLLVIAALVSVAGGCGAGQLQGTSSSYVIVNSLQEGANTKEQFGDVQTIVKVDDKPVATVFEDNAKVSFSLALKDTGVAGAAKPTDVNFVTFTTYHVEFTRTDGRNTPGVDVPYGFDGAMTVTVTDGTTDATFTIVRIQTKEEAPLKALIGGGGAGSISTIANVTFFGRDQSGRAVNVTGRISVNFADWGDPQ